MSRVARMAKDKANRKPSHPSKLRSISSSAGSPKRLSPFERQWHMQMKDSVTAIAWSPNSHHLAATSAAGEVLLGTLAEPPTRLAQESEAMSRVAFSAHGRFLAVSGQSGQVIVWALDGPEPAVVFSRSLTKDWVDCLAWHPTEPILAMGVGPVVQLWDFSIQSLVTELAFERSSILALAWRPQGSHLAVSGHGGVSVWDAENWSAAPEFIEVPGASMAVQWSSEGRYLGSGNLDRTLTVVDWGKPPPWFMQGFPGKVRQVSWSDSLTTSGAPVLAAACTNGITVWERDLQQQDGVWRSRVLETHTQTVKAIAFQPHTFTLASAAQDGKLILWRNAKTVAQILKGPKQGWSAIAWSPDGSSLVAGGQAGELMLWTPSSRGRGFQ